MLKNLLRYLYVDDSTTSSNSFNQGVKFYTVAKKYLSNGGFGLRKWATNDLQLRDYVNNHEQPLESSEISENELAYVENELGISDKYRIVFWLKWNIGKDIFEFEFSDIAESGLGLVYTKRNILKIGASFFHPLRLVCQVVLVVLSFRKAVEVEVEISSAMLWSDSEIDIY